MATYYHGAPEIQPDELQTLCLMNPGYVGYPADATSPSSNMVFLNSTPNSHHQAHVNGLSQAQHQHLVGIPLHQNPPVVSVHDMSPAGSHGLLHRGGEYNLWNPSPTNNSVDLTAHLGHHRASTAAQQGLSLSLSPQQKQNYAINQQSVITPAGGDGQVTFSGPSSAVAQSGGSNGISGLQRVLLGSKYLRAAQQLLDDVVSVGKGVKEESPKTVAKATTLAKGTQECEQTSGRETSGKRATAEPSTAERQELQMKKAKLINMFDEVEQRYRQYHNQMQIVISSFEVIAGVGTARTYTALALQTISKQFRCLRDAISGQIHATSKNLGEEDCPIGSKSDGLSRLRFVDHHLRQQRALQQLGTVQHNAWRPQRGLPERSVSVLRAWLFEHFLHPYPKDSDKHILAKQTGLTRNQVSNWFINARVRLWKPMVEEMYLEETKEQEQQHHQQEHLNHKGDDRSSKSEGEAIPTTAVYGEEDEDMLRSNLKKPRTRESSLIDPMSTLEMDLKPIDTSTTTTTSNSNSTDLFMRFSDFGAPYSIGDISRFGSGQQFTPQPPQYPGNGVSLTLGLQHCEGLSLSGPPPATYLSRNDSSSNNNNIPLGRRLQGLSSSTHDAREYSNSEYESLSIQNGKGFASQLMSDFVT